MATEGKSSVILAIESSCDDTCAAVIRDGKVLSNLIANQTVHKNYGGVVPELASRKHHQQIIPVVSEALKNAGVQRSDIDAVAFTQGPGLLGSLLVGCSFAKGFALSLDIPLIAVNHMEAHVLAHFVEEPKPEFPFLCLTVSGGHTQIVRMNSPSNLQVIGSTRDDAAGEAFDKIGKYLGLEYPAGPIIDRLARKGDARFTFPKPRIEGLDFSFSGLKTAVLYFIRFQVKENPAFVSDHLEDICASVQKTIVDILLEKLEAAANQEHITTVGIAGGVSANSSLRDGLKIKAEQMGWKFFIPDFQYCTDNAAMIAVAADYKYRKEIFANQDVTPEPRMSF